MTDQLTNSYDLQEDELTLEQVESLLADAERNKLICEVSLKDPTEEVKTQEAIKAEAQRVYEEKTRLANIEIRRVQEEAYDARRALIESKLELDRLQRMADQLRRTRLAQERFLMLDQRWANILAQPIYASLLPHQIVGAKRMATQRDMILADSMGLGKTRTVLTACDLIYVLTEEASEDNPLTLEEL